MSDQAVAHRYSTGEEIANSITHGVGGLLAVAGLAILVTFAALRGSAWHVVGCAVFGASMVLLYTSSTLYHAIRAPRAKRVFRRLDHAGIFLLIAGTYTPFTLVSLRGPWGWTLLGIIWVLAITGIVLQTGALRHPVLSVVLYVVMGWTVVIAIRPLLLALPRGGLALLILGGVAYTGGIAFYVWRRLPYHHSIWHGFVLTGTVLHFFAVLFYVIPGMPS
jgi:hemolysin III